MARRMVDGKDKGDQARIAEAAASCDSLLAALRRHERRPKCVTLKEGTPVAFTPALNYSPNSSSAAWATTNA